MDALISGKINSNPHTRGEPKSWGEAISTYRQQKQVLPFEIPKRTIDKDSSGIYANTNHPSVHPAPEVNGTRSKARHPAYDKQEGQIVHTRYMKARQEAAYNPITGKHLSREIESGVQAKEAAEVVTRANRGQDRSLAVESQYDVINFESKRQGLDPEVADQEITKTYIPDSRVPYNIVSTLPHEVHHWAKPELRPREKVVDPKTRFASKFIGRQAYNVVSNVYLDKHEEKTKAENQEAKFNATKAFWKTHVYDPIEVKYYDPDKESDYQKAIRESEMTQGQSVAENIRRNAPTAHLAEGNLYDPVTCQPKNEDAIRQLHRLEQGKAEHSQGILRRVGEFLQNEDDFVAVQDDRALNRVKWKKFEDDHSHGFDIVTNTPHFGRGAQTKHLPKARPEPSLWEVINEEALNSIDHEPLQSLAQGQSVERVDRALVNEGVPPIKTQPFTKESLPGTGRSSRRSDLGMSGRMSGVSAPEKVTPSQREMQKSLSKPSTGRRSQPSTGRRSASGGVRTGGLSNM